MGAQSGDKMRLVLIFVATDYHQAIVCSGGMGKQGKSWKDKQKKRDRGEGEGAREEREGEGGGGRKETEEVRKRESK